MYVRLASAWTDLSGAAHQAGDIVDIDVVTLAELEEQGVVEEYNGTENGAEETVDDQAPRTLIGPGPSTPPDDGAEQIGPGPSGPPKETIQSLIGPGPSAPPKG